MIDSKVFIQKYQKSKWHLSKRSLGMNGFIDSLNIMAAAQKHMTLCFHFKFMTYTLQADFSLTNGLMNTTRIDEGYHNMHCLSLKYGKLFRWISFWPCDLFLWTIEDFGI